MLIAILIILLLFPFQYETKLGIGILNRPFYKVAASHVDLSKHSSDLRETAASRNLHLQKSTCFHIY